MFGEVAKAAVVVGAVLKRKQGAAVLPYVEAVIAREGSIVI
jgi:hypothetical protein